MTAMRIAVYARVSTLDQTPENQIAELRRYASAREWTIVREYVDQGVSGTKERRPALDELIRDAKRRRFAAVVCWRLDRLGRNLKHLVTLLDEWQALGIAFVSLAEGIDCTTPAGRLQMQILAAIAEFERGRIVERVKAGIARAKAQGKRLGRQPYAIGDDRIAAVAGLSLRDAARELGVSRSVVHRYRLSRKPAEPGATFAPDRPASTEPCEMSRKEVSTGQPVAVTIKAAQHTNQ